MTYTTTLYFAYGTDLSHAQIKSRCPNVEMVQSYILQGWELSFYTTADIRPNDNGQVYGAVYKLTESDAQILANAHPAYKQVNLSVTLTDGTTQNAIAHIQTEREKTQKPTEDIFNTVLLGYADWSHPPQHLFNAVANVAGGTPIPVLGL